MRFTNNFDGSRAELLETKSGQPGVGERLSVLDSLRGLAAIAVCFFHFSGRDDLLPGTYLQVVSCQGYLGVVVFFVISGFVIPWSLQRSDYQLGDFPRFLLKRLLRLEPPFLVAVGSVVAFVALYCWVKEQPFPPEEQWWLGVALHVGYLTRFFGYGWLDGVYWTLAIEFQFYLLIGIVFPLLCHRRAEVRWSACALLTAAGVGWMSSADSLGPQITQQIYVTPFLPVFLLGILSYQRRAGLVGTAPYLASAGLVGAMCCWTLNMQIAITALMTAMLITSTKDGWGPLNRLGTISYSLYLFHSTLGGAIINLGIKHTSSPPVRYLVLLAAFSAALAVAVAMYWIIERPARRWSASIRYAPRRDCVLMKRGLA